MKIAWIALILVTLLAWAGWGRQLDKVSDSPKVVVVQGQGSGEDSPRESSAHVPVSRLPVETHVATDPEIDDSSPPSKGARLWRLDELPTKFRNDVKAAWRDCKASTKRLEVVLPLGDPHILLVRAAELVAEYKRLELEETAFSAKITTTLADRLRSQPSSGITVPYDEMATFEDRKQEIEASLPRDSSEYYFASTSDGQSYRFGLWHPIDDAELAQMLKEDTRLRSEYLDPERAHWARFFRFL